MRYIFPDFGQSIRFVLCNILYTVLYVQDKWPTTSWPNGTYIFQLRPSHHGDIDAVGGGDRGEGHEATDQWGRLLHQSVQTLKEQCHFPGPNHGTHIRLELKNVAHGRRKIGIIGEKKVFSKENRSFQRNNPIYYCSRSNQMTSTDQITEISQLGAHLFHE
mgnify:CR=1 FL=1